MQSTVQLKILDAPLPLYPHNLVQKEAAGKIDIDMDVGADGKVTQVKIVSSEVPEMNVATLDALKKWTFVPVVAAGRGAVPLRARISVRFSVQ